MEPVSDATDKQTVSPNLSVLAAASTAPTTAREIRARKKTSTACTVCKKRKTRCSGEYPCDRCIQRGTVADCVIDSNADLRRRGATEKRTEELESDRRLLDGLLEAIRTGNDGQVQWLLNLIRDDASRPDLLAHVDDLLQGSVGSEVSVVGNSQPSSPQDEKAREKMNTHHRPTGSIQDLLNHEPANSNT